MSSATFYFYNPEIKSRQAVVCEFDKRAIELPKQGMRAIKTFLEDHQGHAIQIIDEHDWPQWHANGYSKVPWAKDALQ